MSADHLPRLASFSIGTDVAPDHALPVRQHRAITADAPVRDLSVARVGAGGRARVGQVTSGRAWVGDYDRRGLAQVMRGYGHTQ